MTSITDYINEIERHKGVIVPDPTELGLFAKQLYIGACELVGRHATDDATMQFVENKYKQVLDAVKGFYEDYPARRQFVLRVKWDELEGLQYKLAAHYKRAQEN